MLQAQARPAHADELRLGRTLVPMLDSPWNPIIALSKALPRRVLNRIWMRLARASASVGLVPNHVGPTLSVRSGRPALHEPGLAVEEAAAIVHAPRVLAGVAAQLLKHHASVTSQERVLSLLAAFERLGSAPTRFITRHLVAFRARSL